MSYGLDNTAEKVAHDIERKMRHGMHHHWKSYVVEGVVLIALGVAAVVVPQVASIATDVLIGWLLSVAGVYMVASRLATRDKHDFWTGLLLGILTAVLGAVIALNPAAGVLTLTMMLVAYFIAHGLGMIAIAISARPHTGSWLWFAISALVDFALAGLVLSNWPGTAGWILGLYVGLNLVFGGLGLVFAAIGTHFGSDGSDA